MLGKSPVLSSAVYAGWLPAPVAPLDARPTGDKEAAGSTLTEFSNILSWRLKYFLLSFSPFR